LLPLLCPQFAAAVFVTSGWLLLLLINFNYDVVVPVLWMLLLLSLPVAVSVFVTTNGLLSFVINTCFCCLCCYQLVDTHWLIVAFIK